jgi:hypothetical protein
MGGDLCTSCQHASVTWTQRRWTRLLTGKYLQTVTYWGFIGSVGYLAGDIPGVRIPMGVLSSLTGDTVPYRWGYTEQRAFYEIKTLVEQETRTSGLLGRRLLFTDGCATGISGLVSTENPLKLRRFSQPN